MNQETIRQQDDFEMLPSIEKYVSRDLVPVQKQGGLSLDWFRASWFGHDLEALTPKPSNRKALAVRF